MSKRFLAIYLSISAAVFFGMAYVANAYPVTPPVGGGTGISTTSAGNAGFNLYVVSVNASGVPTYGFQANGSGGGSTTNVLAGTGISVAQVGTNATVTNTGVLSVNALTGTISNIAVTNADNQFSVAQSIPLAPVFSTSTALLDLGSSTQNLTSPTGTFLGINQNVNTGADFVNFVSGNTSQFRIDSNGNTSIHGNVQTIGGTLSVTGVSNLNGITNNGNITSTNETETSVTSSIVKTDSTGRHLAATHPADYVASLTITTTTLTYTKTLDSTTTVVVQNNTSTPTTVYTYSVPGNTLGTSGGSIALNAYGTFLASTTNNQSITFALLYGGVVCSTKGGSAVATSTSLGYWSYHASIANASGTTNNQICDQQMITTAGGGTTVNNTGSGSSSIDSTVAQNIQIRFTINANANEILSTNAVNTLMNGATTTIVTAITAN